MLGISDKSAVRRVLSFLMPYLSTSYNPSSLADKTLLVRPTTSYRTRRKADVAVLHKLWIGLWTNWNEAEDS